MNDCLEGHVRQPDRLRARSCPREAVHGTGCRSPSQCARGSLRRKASAWVVQVCCRQRRPNGRPCTGGSPRNCSRSGPASGLCASCGAARSRSGRPRDRPLGSAEGFVDVARGPIYRAQFCAPCARICALVGDQSIVLGNRRSHFTHVRKTLLPQSFRYLVALRSDTWLFWRLSKVPQLTCKRSLVRVQVRAPNNSSSQQPPVRRP